MQDLAGHREGKATLFFSVMLSAAQGGNPDTDKTTGEAHSIAQETDDAGKEEWAQLI